MISDARARQRFRIGLRARSLLVMSVLPWMALTLLITLQSQIMATLQNRSQALWPALGYTAAIYSVWALLGPVLVAVARRVVAAKAHRLVRAATLALGLPAALALHVGLFSFLYWPIYGQGFASPVEMAPYVLGANLDTGALAYAALIAFGFLHHRKRDAAAAPASVEAVPAPAPIEGLWVRAGGRRQHIALETIDWVGAAGDYVEVHMGAGTILVDSSLSALNTALPQADFARVHRTAIVRRDKVRAVRGVGRGDALLELSNGATVRLSRRYRGALSGWAALG